MYRRSPSRPASYPVTIPGWRSRAAFCASRVNRSTSAGDAPFASRIFSATTRPSFVSRARYTDPIAPSPIWASIS
jgi:hypothetical protein